MYADEFGGCLRGWGGAGESDQWEEIATKALSLDRDDFLSTGYKVSAKFKTVASMPSRSRARLHPSDQSQPSLAKKRQTAVAEEVVNLSDNDVDNEDYCLSKESDKEEEDDVDDEVREDDERLEDLDLVDNNATPPHRWGVTTLCLINFGKIVLYFCVLKLQNCTFYTWI